jgi:hypothetical protein
MIKKNLTRGLQFACGVAVVAAAVGATMHTNDTKAAASAPTGVCGLMMSKNSYGFTAKTCVNTSSTPCDDTSTLLGTINFSNGTANLTTQDIQNPGTSNAYTTISQENFTNVTVGSAVSSGAYQVSFSNANGGSNLLFLPTNNNNTYLVTTNETQTTANGSAPMTGVCQVQ